MKRFLLAALVVCAPLILFTPGAVFADAEIYGGIGVGYHGLKVGQEPLEITNQGQTGLLSRDLSGTTRPVQQFVGLRLGENLGFEFGFVRFGTLNDRAPVPTVPANPNEPLEVNYGVKTYGYDAFLVGFYPLDADLDVFGKVGAVHWDSTTTQTGAGTVTKSDGDDLAYGFGLDFRSSGRLHLRVEVQVYDMAFADESWTVTTSILYALPVDL